MKILAEHGQKIELQDLMTLKHFQKCSYWSRKYVNISLGRKKSLLNCVPYVLTQQRVLRAYVLTYQRVLRA